MNSLTSVIVYDNLKFPFYEMILDLLRPWSACLDLNSTSSLIDSVERGKVNHVLMLSSETECNIASIHTHRGHLNLAEYHCQEALSYLRLYKVEEEEKGIVLLCSALQTFYELRRAQGKYDDAWTFAEEYCNIVAIAYNPVHPEVQDAASKLIECLTYKGGEDNLDRAETFAQMMLNSLKDPTNGLDQQSEEVADGYYNLANVINRRKGDLVKVEMCARESLRIRNLVYYDNHQYVSNSLSLLANILTSQGKLGYETKKLLERSLANDIEEQGPTWLM